MLGSLANGMHGFHLSVPVNTQRKDQENTQGEGHCLKVRRRAPSQE